MSNPTPVPETQPDAGVVIYIDGDACPVRDEIFRVAARLGLAVVLVSNGSRPLRPSGHVNVTAVTVEAGADAADDYIAARIARDDICVTGDIPLAARCLARQARAVSPTGHAWTQDNIGTALAGRDLSRHLRELGLGGGNPAPLAKSDRSQFLNTLDRFAQAALRARLRG